MAAEASSRTDKRLLFDRTLHIQNMLTHSTRGFYWMGALSTMVLVVSLAILAVGFWVSVRFRAYTALSVLGLVSGLVVGGGGLLGFFLAKPLDRLQSAIASIPVLDIAFSGYMEKSDILERWLALRWRDDNLTLEELGTCHAFLEQAGKDALYNIFLYSQERDAMISRAIGELSEAKALLREAREEEGETAPAPAKAEEERETAPAVMTREKEESTEPPPMIGGSYET